MRRERRLTKSREFAEVYQHGRGWSNGFLVLRVLPNTLEISRFGFSIGKRVGKAVIRNKVKRRLREAARLTSVQEGWDIVVIGRKEAGSADYNRLRRSLLGLLGRARLLAESNKEPSKDMKP